MTSSLNKKIGNSFETEFCEVLSSKGFWVHNFASKVEGQPADVIAVRKGRAYLIDCKVCSTSKGFDINRIEENQELSMCLWRECGNGQGWFAIKCDGQIYMIPHLALSVTNRFVKPSEMLNFGSTLEEWLKGVK